MVALVSTLHDPGGRMLEAAERLLGRVADLYEAVVVVPTVDTSPRLLRALAGTTTVAPLAESSGAIGVGRRHALRLGLATGAGHLHYCDLDRLLHWIGSYPEELAAVLESIRQYDYLILGRTRRAFATHPRVQRDTEAITNHAYSIWHGATVDVTAGSCGVSRRAADRLLRRSTAPTNATDAEWPAIIKLSAGYAVGYLETEGLEFETPDYFGDEIAAAGSLEEWLDRRSKPLDAWIARTRLALESMEALRGVVQEAGEEAEMEGT